MKTIFRPLLVATLLGTSLISVAQAKPASKATQPAKMQVLTVCPIMQHEVPKVAGNSQKIGNVQAYFCCGGCKAKFNAMTAAQKKANLTSAMKIQKSKKA